MKATLEHIWHEFAEKLGQFIRARVSDPATAQDILQDVFVKIQKRLSQLQDPAKLQGWIYLIARNSIIDHYRTRKETPPKSDVKHFYEADVPAFDLRKAEDVADLERTLTRMLEGTQKAA